MTTIYWRTCVNGHDLTNGNRYTSPTGRTQCRACKQQHNARRPKATHCRNGHELTEQNVYLNQNGHRRCRACKRESDYRTRPARAPRITSTLQAQPDRYRNWARRTWEAMTESDRQLVRQALCNHEGDSWTTEHSPLIAESGSQNQRDNLASQGRP